MYKKQNDGAKNRNEGTFAKSTLNYKTALNVFLSKHVMFLHDLDFFFSFVRCPQLRNAFENIAVEASKSGSTKALLLKHSLPFQGIAWALAAP